MLLKHYNASPHRANCGEISFSFGTGPLLYLHTKINKNLIKLSTNPEQPDLKSEIVDALFYIPTQAKIQFENCNVLQYNINYTISKFINVIETCGLT